jgi:hypothetical protein
MPTRFVLLALAALLAVPACQPRFSTSSGTPASWHPDTSLPDPVPPSAPLPAPAILLAVRDVRGTDVDLWNQGQRIQRIALGDTEPSWDLRFANANMMNDQTGAFGLMLTSAGTIVFQSCEYLVVGSFDEPRCAYREIGVDGFEHYRVPLPGQGDVAYLSRAALRGGRWYVAGEGPTVSWSSPPAFAVVRAFDLPGREPATVGWVGELGGPSRDARAR